MVKKIIKRLCVLGLFLTVFISLFVPVLAEDTGVLRFGRVYAYMPEITAEIYGTGYDAGAVTVMLGQEKLMVDRVSAFDPVADSVSAFILVDLSTSMSGQLDAVKKCLMKYVNAMNPQDSLAVITFGEKVETLLTGGESKEEIIENLSGLEANQKGTLFFEAMDYANRLISARKSAFAREYIMVFTDGFDYQKGSTTFEETVKKFSIHDIPAYVVCTPNADKASVDRVGEIARSSGGAVTVLRAGKEEEDFESFLTAINDVTILKLRAQTNIALGDEKTLSVKTATAQADIKVLMKRSLPDNEPPSVTEIRYDSEANAFLVTFSENVDNAAVRAAYTITNKKGKQVEINDVLYEETSKTAVIRISGKMYSGEYTFAFKGIVDRSMQQNELSAGKSIVVEALHPARAYIVPILIILAILCILLLLLLLLIFVSKRKRTEQLEVDSLNMQLQHTIIENEYEAAGGFVEVKHHIKTPSAVHAVLRVKTGKNSEQKIAVDIASSIIIGRSDACDVYVDDTKMSRQHFAIENENGLLMITDLGSTNGTMLNGITIGSRQKLESGDRIVAGLSEITISITQ